jgi:hypothetical protein
MTRRPIYNRKEPVLTFALFPYLKTSTAVHYRGLTFRCTTDTTGLPPDVVEHLAVLRQRFYLRDNLRISRFIFTYAVVPSEGPDAEDFLRKIREFRTLVTYTYGNPDQIDFDPWLTSEHGTAFIVRPNVVYKHLVEHDHNVELTNCPTLNLPPNEEFVDGYEGVIGSRDHFWFVPESQLYPPVGHLWLNISQDLGEDLDREAQYHQLTLFYHFAGRHRLSAFDERVLTALEWYNRSISRQSDEEVLLVSLAVAFESLLGLEAGDKVTARFKESVGLLLGPIPRLDSWLSQFYDARSDIVHEGRTERMMFLPIDDPKKHPKGEAPRYRSLIAYGRTVFRICVTTILTGSRLAETLQVASLFQTNTERLEEVCRIVRESSGKPRDGLLAAEDLIRTTDQNRFVSDSGLTVDRLIGTLKVIADAYSATSPSEPPETMAVLHDLRGVKTSEHLRALELIRRLKQSLTEPVDQQTSDDRTRRVVRMLTQTVWHYTFTYYWALEREAKSSPEFDTPTSEHADNAEPQQS